MEFGTEKKGYNAQEVDAFIERLRREYEGVLTEQRQRILDLKSQLELSEKNIAAYKEKSNLVSQAIYNAVSKADEIEKLSKIRYNQEIQQLKTFHNKWLSYYNNLLKKYPLDDDLIATSKFNRQMSNILSRTDADKKYNDERVRLNDLNVSSSSPLEKKQEELIENLVPNGFDPVNRIKMYLTQEEESATTQVDKVYTDRSPNGFSFDEALHPKEDLSEIMRDLGILLED